MPHPRGLILYFVFKSAVSRPHPPMSLCVVLLMTVLSSTMQMLLVMGNYVMQQLYPAHLQVDFEVLNRMTNIPFMNLLIVKVKPLETSVCCKPTRTCSYIPLGSNTPRHVQLAWITGECIRFLRLCSHEHYFNACWARLQGALMRLGYPKHALRIAPRQWSDKRRYVHDCGKVSEIVHAVRVPYHSCMPIPWMAMFSRIRYKLFPSIPSLQVPR